MVQESLEFQEVEGILEIVEEVFPEEESESPLGVDSDAVGKTY